MIANILIAILVSLSNIAATETEHRITTYSTGHRTADGSVIDYSGVANGTVRWCAVDQQHRKRYPYGSIILVEGRGFFIVHDCTAAWVGRKWPEGTVDLLCHPSWDNQWREWKRVWIIWRTR